MKIRKPGIMISGFFLFKENIYIKRIYNKIRTTPAIAIVA